MGENSDCTRASRVRIFVRRRTIEEREENWGKTRVLSVESESRERRNLSSAVSWSIISRQTPILLLYFYFSLTHLFLLFLFFQIRIRLTSKGKKKKIKERTKLFELEFVEGNLTLDRKEKKKERKSLREKLPLKLTRLDGSRFIFLINVPVPREELCHFWLEWKFQFAATLPFWSGFVLFLSNSLALTSARRRWEKIREQGTGSSFNILARVSRDKRALQSINSRCVCFGGETLS